MSRAGRIRSVTVAAGRAFLRRRTAVFFTFFFPAIIILIFGAVVQTAGGSGGLFTEPPGYYVPGYLAVVVLFTPLSRVGSEVARHREDNRFEKLATTPLRRWEWLAAQTLVNVGIIGVAAAGVLGVALFCGLGAILGSLSDSSDGVIAASNGIALPLLFLSETFVPASLLPGWLPLWLSPLTYFSRGVRAVTYQPSETLATSQVPGGLGLVESDLLVLAVLTLAFFVVGAVTLPRTD
ncbi:ABC transporter permease [Halobacteriales archaeon SW_8_65_20]|nr:MAG: ABC transporter permease [Halobacteriales archaeon SW_8_65_20]